MPKTAKASKRNGIGFAGMVNASQERASAYPNEGMFGDDDVIINVASNTMTDVNDNKKYDKINNIRNDIRNTEDSTGKDMLSDAINNAKNDGNYDSRNNNRSDSRNDVKNNISEPVVAPVPTLSVSQEIGIGSSYSENSSIKWDYEHGTMPGRHRDLYKALKTVLQTQVGEGALAGEIHLEDALNIAKMKRYSAMQIMKHLQHFGYIDYQGKYRRTWVRILR